MLKICFNHQTHLVSKHPANFEDLLSKIHQLFGKDLPPRWILQYKDSDSDLITLETKADYQELLQELPKFGRTLKIFIVPQNPDLHTSPPNPNQLSSSSYFVVENNTIRSPLKNSAVLETKSPEEALESQQQQQEEEEKLDQLKPATSAIRKESQESHQTQSQNESFSDANSELRRPTFKPAVDEIKDITKGEEENSQPFEEELQYEAKLYQYLEDMRAQEEEERREEKKFRDMFMKVFNEQMPVFVEMIKQQLKEDQAMENISYIHEVKCNGCKRFPIIGTRYQCVVCPDFTFCEKCEETHDHMHPLAKLKKKRDQEFVKPVQQMNTSSIHLEKSLKSSQSQRPKIEQIQSILLDPLESQANLLASLKVPRGFRENQKISRRKSNDKAAAREEMGKSDLFLKPRRDQRKDPLESFRESVKAQGKNLREKSERKQEVSSEVKQKAGMLQEFFGGDAEKILRFVKENSGLEMDELGEKYLNFISC